MFLNEIFLYIYTTVDYIFEQNNNNDNILLRFKNNILNKIICVVLGTDTYT